MRGRAKALHALQRARARQGQGSLLHDRLSSHTAAADFDFLSRLATPTAQQVQDTAWAVRGSAAAQRWGCPPQLRPLWGALRVRCVASG
jgi:hypothetical protein